MRALHDARVEDFSAELVALAQAKGATAAQAQTKSRRYLEMQFDRRGVDLVRSTKDEVSSIVVFRDGKRGAATLNGRGSDEIAAALDGALKAVDAGVVDEANDVADAQSLPATSHGPDAPDRERMAGGVEAFLAALDAKFPQVRIRDCLHHFSDVKTAFANSRGLRQKGRRGHYGYSSMFMAKDGTRTTSINYTAATSYAPFDNPIAAGDTYRLLCETVASLDRKPVPQKFDGDVIITPMCLASLMGSIVGALSGPALFTGATPYRNKKGEAIASPLFTFSNRPRDPGSPGGEDFDDYGMPTRDLRVVTNGVLNDFLVDYFFSKKLGVAQTAGAQKFQVAPGDAVLGDMIANTKRGILFSRFSGGMPNSNLDFTGIAKNSFYIEEGVIRYALEETMVSGNFQELLKNILAVSKECVDFGNGIYPFVSASGVTISSK